MRSVLLVDDHPVVRQGLGRVLAAEFPDLRLSEAVDGESAFDKMRAAAFHLVLLDLALPGDSGLAVLRRMRREFPAVPVLVVSMHPADQFAQRALQAGAAGYLAKGADTRELVRAVHAVLAGERYLPPEIEEAARLAADPPRHEALSDREYQVLRMIGSGRTVSEISRELGVSVKTVSTYRARVLEKLRLRTSAELIHYAIVNGLVP
jgi:two-component system, NarL family, invasion response regulator UvrY